MDPPMPQPENALKTWLFFRVIFVPKMSSAIFTQVPCMNIKLIIQNIYEINLHDPRIVD